MCRDGTCESLFLSCEGHGGSVCSSVLDVYCPYERSCYRLPSHPCSRLTYCRKCDDNSCSRDGKCPGECSSFHKRCNEGCVPRYKRCKGECDSWKKKCQNGQCVSSSQLCADENCPSHKTNLCNDGKKCYYNYDKCDSGWDCDDGSDEWNCPNTSESDSDSGSTGLWILVIIPIILIVMCMVLVCKKGTNKNRHGEMDVQEEDIILEPGEVRSGIGAYTGTRMVPLAPLNHGNRVAPGIGGVHHIAPSAPEPCAPPPSYDEVVKEDQIGTPPPPPYSSV